MSEKIKRSKQTRRNILKSMAIGSGAVASAKAVPEQWTKPVLNSLILPAHGQTSPLCEFSATSEVLQNPDVPVSLGTFDFPGSETVLIGSDADLTFNVEAMVTPGITDDFTLSATSDDVDFGGFPQNAAPDPTNGQLNFTSLNTGAFLGEITFTITPDVEDCGGPQSLELDLSPAG